MFKRMGIFLALGAILLAVEFSSNQVVASDHPTEAVTTHDHDHDMTLAPISKEYSGSTPIDLNHGGCGNNGTFGRPDPQYESLRTAALTAPGLLAAPYEFRSKSQFLNGYTERIAFFDEAIRNLNEKTATTKPEAAEFSNQAATQLSSLLEQAKKGLIAAKNAGSSDWMAAQSQARDALNALLGTYSTLTSSAR